MTNRTVAWWNPELTDLRKKVTSAKKQLLRAQKLHLQEVMADYTETYKSLRNQYVTRIRKCKKETWQEFVEGNKDPWGIAYKIVREKFNRSSFWTALKLPPDGRITSSIVG